MYICPICSDSEVSSLVDLRIHLNRHKIDGQLCYPISCCQSNCRSTLESITSYVRHFENFHLCDLDSDLDQILPQELENCNRLTENVSNVEEVLMDTGENDLGDCETNMGEDSNGLCFSQKMENLINLMKDEVQNVLVDLRGKGNIPLKLSVDVIKYVGNFVDLIVEKVCDAIESEFTPFVLPVGILKNILRSLETLKNVLPTFAGSEYRVRKFCEKHPRFVLPQEIPLGSRDEIKLSMVNGQSTMTIVKKSNNAQYISIARTIKGELQDPVFRKIVLEKPILQDGVYTCFHSGARYKTNPSFCNPPPSKHVIFLQIFFDGLGITNALRDASKIHNSGMYYFTILNVPPRFNAALSNIHLIAMCNSMDLKDGGFDVIAEKIVEECNALAEHGIMVETENGPVTFYVNVVQFTGDNLGLNQLFGFIESFSGDYCCQLCYATREEMNTFHKESDFQLRTKEEYDFDIINLSELPPGKNHVRGVKKSCVFNNLINFHICENWINDSMHTIAEGIGPYVTGNILYSISKLDSSVTVDAINQELNNLFSALVIDRHNRPCLINGFLEPGNGISPKQSAAQQMAFCRYLPFILNKLVKNNEECSAYIELLCLLQEIMDIAFCPRLTDSLLEYFSFVITKFLFGFKNLYPSSSIRPKMHFLVHYPSIIRKNGPTRNFWCMNYERMNGAVKIPSHIMKNFRDPQKTLAYRVQCAALYSGIERRHNRDFILIRKCTEESVELLEFAENFDYFSPWFSSDSVFVSSKIVVNGTEYRNGTFVVLELSDIGYRFGEIICVVCENIEHPLLFVTVFESVDFHTNTHCYEIIPKVPSTGRLCEISGKCLLDPIPLDGIKCSDSVFIRLKYHIIGNVATT